MIEKPETTKIKFLLEKQSRTGVWKKAYASINIGEIREEYNIWVQSACVPKDHLRILKVTTVEITL